MLPYLSHSFSWPAQTLNSLIHAQSFLEIHPPPRLWPLKKLLRCDLYHLRISTSWFTVRSIQTQDWHHNLALSICGNLYQTDGDDLPAVPRLSWSPAWSGPSGFSLTYVDLHPAITKNLWFLLNLKWNTVQQNTNPSENSEVPMVFLGS